MGEFPSNDTLTLVLGQVKDTADATAIKNSVSRQRFARYTSATGGSVIDAARLYVLDSELRGALLELLHFYEIAFRDAIHAVLTNAYGADWYRGLTVVLDDRTRETFREAEARISAGKQTPERTIAEVSLGGWGDLLEIGGTSSGGHGAMAGRADYESSLWSTRIETLFKGLHSSRQDAAAHVRRVRRLRNRVAHHESIIFGVHQPGEKTSSGKQKRQEPQAALTDLRTLIDQFCPHGSAWLGSCRHADEVLGDSLAVAALADARVRRTTVHWF